MPDTSAAVQVLVASRVYQTRVIGLSLPARQEAHTPLRITGTTQALIGSAWKPLGFVTVGLYYRVLPAGTWVYAGSAKTVSVYGSFSWREPVSAIGDLAWQARVYSAVIGTSGFAPSSAGRDGVLVDQTNTHVTVGSVGADVVINAAVLDHAPGSAPSQCIANVTGLVQSDNLAKGSTAGRYLGSARIGSGGTVTFPSAGALSGSYRAVPFAAQRYFLGSSATVAS